MLKYAQYQMENFNNVIQQNIKVSLKLLNYMPYKLYLFN